MRARRLALGSLLLLVLVVWCGWASGLHHSSSAAFAAWAVELLAVVVIDLLMWRGRTHRRFALRLQPVDQPWPRPGRGGARQSSVGTAPWLLLALVVVVWEVLGIDTGAQQPHLTISALAQAFRPFNAGVLLVWILVGVGFGAALATAPVASTPRGRSDPGRLANLSGAVAFHHQHRGLSGLLLPADRGAGVAFWLAVVVAAVCIDQVARASRGGLATAEELVRFVSRPTIVRILLPLAWAYAGWHLFAH